MPQLAEGLLGGGAGRHLRPEYGVGCEDAVGAGEWRRAGGTRRPRLRLAVGVAAHHQFEHGHVFWRLRPRRPECRLMTSND